MKTKILFVSHEASLTGAPLVLLYFMEWLKAQHHNKYEIGILHLKTGEIEERFNAIADNVHNLEHKTSKSILFKVVNKLSQGQLAKKQKTLLERTIQSVTAYNYDIIYANTAVALPVGVEIKKASKNKPKLIAHIHELNLILNQSLKEKTIFKSVDKVIAVSKLVKDNLKRNWEVKDKNISVVYEFSKINLKEKIVTKNNSKFVVGASGLAHWRKGYDLFIQVARYVKTNYKDKSIVFCWVGKILEKEKQVLEADLEKLELKSTVKFVGQQQNPYSFFKDFDVFLMTSREDPFPLVCIEVGMLGKPIICFDKATGTQEMLTNGGGKIVPYLNIEQMSKEIINYYDDRGQLQKDSKIVKTAFSDFSPDKQCPKIYDTINQL